MIAQAGTGIDGTGGEQPRFTLVEGNVVQLWAPPRRPLTPSNSNNTNRFEFLFVYVKRVQDRENNNTSATGIGAEGSLLIELWGTKLGARDWYERAAKLCMVGGPCPTLRMQLQPGTCPFSVLGLWGKITIPSAGIMVYRRDLPSTTGI